MTDSSSMKKKQKAGKASTKSKELESLPDPDTREAQAPSETSQETVTMPVMSGDPETVAGSQLQLSKRKAGKQRVADDAGNAQRETKIDADREIVEAFYKLSTGTKKDPHTQTFAKVFEKALTADSDIKELRERHSMILTSMLWKSEHGLSAAIDEFLEVIGASKTRDIMEADTNYPDIKTASESLKQRFHWIERDETVKCWKSSETDRILVLNGKEEADGAFAAVCMWSKKRTSPDEKDKKSKLFAEHITLHYSCAVAPDRKPRDVVAYLLGRLLADSSLLLEVPPFEMLGPPTKGQDKRENKKKAYHQFTFPELLNLLVGHIHQQLTKKEVWVILDNVSFYTGATRKAEMKVLFDALANIVNNKVKGEEFMMRMAVTSHSTTEIAAGTDGVRIVNVKKF